MRLMLTGLAALILAPAAMAQSAFVPIQQEPSRVTFVDLGGVQRDGAELVLPVLEFSASRMDQPAPYRASLSTYRFSCDWSTMQMMGSVIHSPDGKATPDPNFVAVSQPSYFGAYGWHAAAAPLICDPDAKPPIDAPASVEAAIRNAQAITTRPPAPQPEPPPKPGASQQMMMVAPAPPRAFEMPNFASPAPSRYGLVGRQVSTGNLFFLDWGNLTRTGDIVHALAVDALGAPNDGPWIRDRMRLNSLEIDCKAMSVTILAYVAFNDGLTAGHQQDKDWPARTARNWPLGGLIAEAACKGEEPAATLPTRNAILATQQVWREKQAAAN